MSAIHLMVNLQSYWHPGTGRGGGFYLDALSHTGADGLPRLPGRTIKGLLRDAVYRAECWRWPEFKAGTTTVLFGSRQAVEDLDAAKDSARFSTQGLLRFSDATLAPEITRYLQDPHGQKLIPELYREHFSTAILHHSGTALDRSLRGIQVVVPLELEATVASIADIYAADELQDLRAQLGTPETWQSLLGKVFNLVPAVGAYRSRGFGRVSLSWGNCQGA